MVKVLYFFKLIILTYFEVILFFNVNIRYFFDLIFLTDFDIIFLVVNLLFYFFKLAILAYFEFNLMFMIMAMFFIYPLTAILIYYLNFNLFLLLHCPLSSLFFLALTTQYAAYYAFEVPPPRALCYDYYGNHHKIDHPD